MGRIMERGYRRTFRASESMKARVLDLVRSLGEDFPLVDASGVSVRLGVSETSAREALYALEHEGLLVSYESEADRKNYEATLRRNAASGRPIGRQVVRRPRRYYRLASPPEGSEPGSEPR